MSTQNANHRYVVSLLTAAGLRRCLLGAVLSQFSILNSQSPTLPCATLGSTLLARAQESAPASAATHPASQPAVRFAALDVFIDTRAHLLAAYQFELTAEVGQVKIVGIEGGQHPAFKEPPYYDPAALSHDRVIIAAFNTGTNLPTGRTRLARVHLQITGDREPQYVAKVMVAASTDARPITDALITVEQGARP